MMTSRAAEEHGEYREGHQGPRNGTSTYCRQQIPASLNLQLTKEDGKTMGEDTKRVRMHQ